MINARFQLQRPGFELQVELNLPSSGITVLLGPSGSGKTTLLRCMAGLEPGARGELRVGQEVWQDDAVKPPVCLPTWRRSLGYVFQEASLFEHLTVQGNLKFGLKRAQRQYSHAEQTSGTSVMAEAVKILGIGHLLDRSVLTLSGGERQRVAIARALVTQPRLLLLDEPLAAVDETQREELMGWLERLRDESALPMVYVTHAMNEATRLADTLVLMSQGRVRRVGPVAEVLGQEGETLLNAWVVGKDPRWHLMTLAFSGGELVLPDSGLSEGSRTRARILARDVSLSRHRPQDSSIQNSWLCVILGLEPGTHPAQVLVQLRLGDQPLQASITARAWEQLQLKPGDSVWALVKAVSLVGGSISN
jgi:molybdate transport system ATP-binding protein